MNKKIIKTKILPKLTSDHKPIQLLLEDEEDLGPLPFHFSPLWIEREGFIDTVKEAWAKSISGSSKFCLGAKTQGHKVCSEGLDKETSPQSNQHKKRSSAHFGELAS